MLGAILRVFFIAFATARADKFTQFFVNIQYCVPSIQNYKLPESPAALIITVCQPTKSVTNFTIPGSLWFPSYFLDVLYRIEGEVNFELLQFRYATAFLAFLFG